MPLGVASALAVLYGRRAIYLVPPLLVPALAEALQWVFPNFMGHSAFYVADVVNNYIGMLMGGVLGVPVFIALHGLQDPSVQSGGPRTDEPGLRA